MDTHTLRVFDRSNPGMLAFNKTELRGKTIALDNGETLVHIRCLHDGVHTHLISRSAHIAKAVVIRNKDMPAIFITSVVEEGIQQTIGRPHELQLTLADAIKLHGQLSIYIEDSAYRLYGESDKASETTKVQLIEAMLRIPHALPPTKPGHDIVQPNRARWLRIAKWASTQALSSHN